MNTGVLHVALKNQGEQRGCLPINYYYEKKYNDYFLPDADG